MIQSVQRTLKRKLAAAIEKGDLLSLQNLLPALNKVLDKPNNLILCGDAYKYSHPKFHEDGLEKYYSYLESRGGKFYETVFYGLQIFIKEYLEGVAIIQEDLDEAYEYLGTKYGVFGRDDVFDKSKFQYIIDVHGGRLPVEIKAVPEGTVVNTKNVLMTVESTDPNCAWLVGFLETILLQVWYPITVATLSRKVKTIVTKVFRESSDLPIEVQDIAIQFVLNDFGFRGVSSTQSARNGGSAHLLNFMGSDNLAGSKGVIDFYNTQTVYGLSIPATEHSIMTVKGEAGELEMMKRVLTQFPTGIVACVSDSYNIFRAVSQYWGTDLIDMILSRPAAPGNQLVIRPDSGHVINTLREIFKLLFEKFGYTVNSKGYKVLPPQVRVIQGDGVNLESIKEIYDMFRVEKIAAENLALGMGGKLLQSDIDRDTLKFAFKASFAIVNGEQRDLVKSPIEMDADGNIVPSFKKSKQGHMKLVKIEGGYTTITSLMEGYAEAKDELIVVFRNGELIKDWTFEECRDRVSKAA